MTEPKMLAMWKGRPVTELTREELLEALDWCSLEIRRMREDHGRDMDLMVMLSSRFSR